MFGFGHRRRSVKKRFSISSKPKKQKKFASKSRGRAVGKRIAMGDNDYFFYQTKYRKNR